MRRNNSSSLLGIAFKCLVLFVCFWLGQVASAHGQAPSTQIVELRQIEADGQDELRIAKLSLRNRRVIASDIFAFQRGDDILLPLLETSLALGFPIELDEKNETATGWFIREDQRIKLQLLEGRGNVKGKNVTFDPVIIATDGVDRFIPAKWLDAWFGLNISWNSKTQTVDFEPEYALPQEEAQKRASKSRTYTSSREIFSLEALDTYNARPSLVSWPHGDLNLSTTYDSQNTEWSTRTSLALTGDLLFMTGDVFANIQSDGSKDIRVLLRRSDAQGQMFGLMKATKFEIGDISTESAPLIGSNSNGLGVLVSSERLQRGTNFDTTRIEGDALPGWQAELYRDGQLLSFQTINDSGRYRFDDVELLFGNNRFRIVLYGPSGEQREESQTINISDSFLPTGKTEAAFEMIAPQLGVFKNRRDPTLMSVGNATASTVELSSQFRVARGVANWLTLSGALGFEQFDDDRLISKGQLGLAGRYSRVLWNGDLAISDGQFAGQISARTDYKGIGVTASAKQFGEGFIGDSTTTSDNGIKSTYDVRLDGRVKLWRARSPSAWSASLSRSESFGGRKTESASARLNTRYGPLSIAQTTNWQRTSQLGDIIDTQWGGRTNLAGSLKGFRLQGGIDYQANPKFDFRRADLDVSRRTGNITLGANYAHSFQDNGADLGLRVAYDIKGIRLGMDFRHNFNTDAYSAGLTLSTALDKSPANRKLRFGHSARRNRGSAIVNVFKDDNLNSRFDPGEERLSANLQIQPTGRQEEMDDGKILIQDLPTDRMVGVKVMAETLYDPFLAPTSIGTAFTARNGGVVEIDLPVVETGEITIYALNSDEAPVSGKVISAISCDDKDDIRRERTAFDGVALFQFVLPGCYQISHPNAEPIQLTIKSGDLLEGNLVLRTDRFAALDLQRLHID